MPKLKIVNRRIAKATPSIQSILSAFKTRAKTKEAYDLIVAVSVTTLIFAYDWQQPAATIGAIPLSFIAVVTTFLFHELAHRFVARKLNCLAVYELWLPGVIFGLLMMLVGIKFIIVGAVVIHTYMFGRWGMKSRPPSMREIGYISVSGPLTNLIMASVFSALAGAVSASSGMNVVFSYLASINAWFALFNLVPVKPLDGSKVFFWNQIIWAFLVLFSILLLTPWNIFGPLFGQLLA